MGGLLQLPKKGNLCIITSSIKDVMVLRQHGFPAICFNGEAYGVNKNSTSGKFVSDTITILKKRFKNVILFLDNDEPGIQAAVKLQQINSIPLMCLTVEKDISDYQKKKGTHKTFRILKKMLSKKLRPHELF